MKNPMKEIRKRIITKIIRKDTLKTEQVNEKQNATEMQDEFPDDICEELSRLHYYIGYINLSRLMDIAHEGVLDKLFYTQPKMAV